MALVEGSIIVITGPPGAGKSTVARIVADSFDAAVLLGGDEFFHFIRRGYIPPWQAGSQRQNEVVIDAIAAASASYALGSYLVVVDGIIGPWFVDRWLANLPDGLAVHYVVLWPSKQVALRRAIERTGKTDLTDPTPVTFIHDVFAERGGFDDHVVDSSMLTAEETASAVLRLASDDRLLLTR